MTDAETVRVKCPNRKHPAHRDQPSPFVMPRCSTCHARVNQVGRLVEATLAEPDASLLRLGRAVAAGRAIYWNQNPEDGQHDLSEVVWGEIDNGDHEGSFVFAVEKAVVVPDIWLAVRHDAADDGDLSFTEHASQEEAAAALAAQPGETKA